MSRNPVLAAALAPPIRSEKDEEHACDNLVCRTGAARDDVVRFSQARASQQSPGISDRRYRIRNVAFWWEVKAEDGQLSPAQVQFLNRELDCGELAACGTEADLLGFLEAMNRQMHRGSYRFEPAALKPVCFALIEAWSLTFAERRRTRLKQ